MAFLMARLNNQHQKKQPLKEATCKISFSCLLLIKMLRDIFRTQMLEQVLLKTRLIVITHHHPHTNLLLSVQRALYTPNTQKEDLKSYLDHYHQNDTRDGVVFDFQ